MNKFIISLKKFFTNKNTVTIICVIGALIVLYAGYNYRIKQITRPIKVPYALQEIAPRTKIEPNMIGWMDIPRSMLNNNVIKDATQLYDLYVNYNTVIPEGSIFYKPQIIPWSQMPDSAWSEIPDGFTVVSIPVTNETTYGNSIFPENYIDLYYAANDENGKLLLGKLVESIKVLAVKDNAGNHVFENAGELKPAASLIFAVPEDLHLLVRKASYLPGEIIPVPRNASYSQKPGATVVSSQYIKNFILSQTVDLSNEKNNEDINIKE